MHKGRCGQEMWVDKVTGLPSRQPVPNSMGRREPEKVKELWSDLVRDGLWEELLQQWD